MFELKENFWGERQSKRLPAAFAELAQIIKGMSVHDHPPYSQLIQLMHQVHSGEGSYQLNDSDIYNINWKPQVDFGDDFLERDNIKFLHQLEAFKYDADEKIGDLEKLEFRQFRKYLQTKDSPHQNPYLYIGEVHKNTNLPYGRGILVMAFGDIFEGHFKDGVPQGRCRWI